MLGWLRRSLILIFSVLLVAGIVHSYIAHRVVENPLIVAIDVYFENSAQINITNGYGVTRRITIARVEDKAIITNETHEICRVEAPYNHFNVIPYYHNRTLLIEVYNTPCNYTITNFAIKPLVVSVYNYRYLAYCLDNGLCEEWIIGENPVIYRIRKEECEENNLGCTILNALKGFFNFIAHLIVSILPDPIKHFFTMVGQFFSMLGLMIVELVKYIPYVLLTIGLIFGLGLFVYVLEHGLIGIVMYFEDIYELFKKFLELILRVLDLIIPF